MNKKGFTLIELVTAVVLVSLIIIPAFTIILNYKNKYQIASDKRELNKFQYLVTTNIEKDILQKGLMCMHWGDCASASCALGEVKPLASPFAATDVNFQMALVFNDSTCKTLEVNTASDNKYIKYGDDKYTLPVQYAEILKYSDVKTSFSRTYIEYGGGTGNTLHYFTIFIPIKYVDDTNSDEVLDYGIHIVAEKPQSTP